MIEHPTKLLPKPLHPPEAAANNTAADKMGEVDSRQLFADAKALFIRHDGERYTLRLTSKGKLILTK
jgi:hemin uptake protein HemP